MFSIIRHKMPFVLFGVTILFTIAKYYEFYATWFYYLPDLLGYSLFTNLFMLSVYMNKRYCDATKVCVLGLIALNLYNIASIGMDHYEVFYDFYIIMITIVIMGVYFLKKKN